MRILNLYAGVGGNRVLWGDDHEIVAVENDRKITSIYSDLYPNDQVIVADAHQYLLDNITNFDFIWSSPPCPSHSQLRYNMGYLANRKYAKVAPMYADMKLYEEILLLKYYSGKTYWVVENTIPYYEPLIAGVKTGGHIFWSNFEIGEIKTTNRGHRGGTVESLSKRKMINLDTYNIKNKRTILRSCVEPEVGKHILDKVTHL